MSLDLHPSEPYEFTVQDDVKTSPLAGPQPGLYNELLVSNFTGEELVIVYDDGVTQDIPPVTVGYNRYNRRCIIQRRSTLKPQVNDDGIMGNGYKVNMTLRSWVLNGSTIDNGPVYIKELNWLICYKHQLVNAEHPFRRTNFRDAQQILLSSLIDSKQTSPTCHFLANDPLKRFDRLFCDIAGIATELPVTNLIGENNTEATLVVIITRGSDTTRKEYKIEDIVKDGYLVLPNCPIGVVGLSANLVDSHRHDVTYSQKDLDNEIARQKVIISKQYEQQIANLKLEKETLEQEKEQLKLQRDKAVQEAKIANEQYNTLTGNIRGNVDIQTYSAGQAKANATMAEQNAKKYSLILGIISAVSSVLTVFVTFFKGFFEIFKPAKT